MKNVSITWQTPSRRPIQTTNRNACLVHIYPSGPAMGSRYVLGTQPLTLGRSDECNIHINDHSVSRHHACIEPTSDGYVAVDLQSTNGTFVNEQIATRLPLADGDYLRIGNCIYRFLAGGNVEASYHEEIYRLAIIDAMTGIHNKRYFLEFLERELLRSQRHGRPLALVMFDIDHFKAINDSLGHLGGDYTLREVVTCLRGEVRGDDLFARYGGEEFVVVLVETARNGVLAQAERMRELVASRLFRYEGKSYPLTISLGVACTQGEEVLSAQDLIHLADDNLYQAKHQGRNRVIG